MSFSDSRTENHVNPGHAYHSNDFQIRLVVACPRSGCTLLMRICQGLPGCAVTSHLVLQENHRRSVDESLACVKPDYTIFTSGISHPLCEDAISKGCSTLISMEELGHEFSKGERDFALFPNRAAYEKTRPAFLIRVPLRVFDSWKKTGWGDLDSLLVCYKAMIRMLNASPQPKPVVYEQLITDPQEVMAGLCKYWHISFDKACLDSRRQLGDSIANKDREWPTYQGAIPEGLLDGEKLHSEIEDFRSYGLVSKLEVECIEFESGRLYLQSCGTYLDTLRSRLASSTWLGFDLDDTPHEFRKASAFASAAVFEQIGKDTGLAVLDLTATYGRILKSTTTNAFSDGRTSTHYRRERFNLLFDAYNMGINEETMNHLLVIYKSNLKAALTLKTSASQLLARTKGLGKKVIIITEGPQDAQEWSIVELGLKPYVDVLVTTNDMGKTKVDGLFAAVLERYQIPPQEIVFVGDNEARDIVPAQSEGMAAIHYDEDGNCRFDDPFEFRINSLTKLEYLLD